MAKNVFIAATRDIDRGPWVQIHECPEDDAFDWLAKFIMDPENGAVACGFKRIEVQPSMTYPVDFPIYVWEGGNAIHQRLCGPFLEPLFGSFYPEEDDEEDDDDYDAEDDEAENNEAVADGEALVRGWPKPWYIPVEQGRKKKRRKRRPRISRARTR